MGSWSGQTLLMREERFWEGMELCFLGLAFGLGVVVDMPRWDLEGIGEEELVSLQVVLGQAGRLVQDEQCASGRGDVATT